MEMSRAFMVGLMAAVLHAAGNEDTIPQDSVNMADCLLAEAEDQADQRIQEDERERIRLVQVAQSLREDDPESEPEIEIDVHGRPIRK